MGNLTKDPVYINIPTKLDTTPVKNKPIDNANNPYRKMAIDAKDAVVEGAQYLKDKVMGTAKQNADAEAEMAKQDAQSPDTAQAKVNRLLGKKKGGMIKKMSSGGISRTSASKRADGIALKGHTRGKYL